MILTSTRFLESRLVLCVQSPDHFHLGYISKLIYSWPWTQFDKNFPPETLISLDFYLKMMNFSFWRRLDSIGESGITLQFFYWSLSPLAWKVRAQNQPPSSCQRISALYTKSLQKYLKCAFCCFNCLDLQLRSKKFEITQFSFYNWKVEFISNTTCCDSLTWWPAAWWLILDNVSKPKLVCNWRVSSFALWLAYLSATVTAFQHLWLACNCHRCPCSVPVSIFYRCPL